MFFNTIIFIFCFLPFTLLLYYISSEKVKNSILLLASLIFYAWGSPYTLHIIFITILLNYILGILLTKFSKQKLLILAMTILCNIAILIYYKYTNFLITAFNDSFGETLKPITLIAPIGISYIAFQCISYVVDIYKGEEKPVTNFIDFAMYITLFPKLVAGPILKFKDFSYQLKGRVCSIDTFSQGIYRFSLGLGKKVLIANELEIVANNFFAAKPYTLGIGYAWIGMIVYTLQIYFDFSGYTDMAIGLGEMFGFKLPENFNKPYTATSINDFWKRWHISLSSFLRDYIYIPLGGNRRGRFRGYMNTFIVFFISGFWHGSNYTFIIWGIYHGVLCIIEKSFLNKLLKKLPRFLCQIYAFIAAAVGWVFFRSDTTYYSLSYIKALIVPRTPMYGYHNYGINSKFIFVFILAFIIAIIPRIKITYLKNDGQVTLSLKLLFSLVIFILSAASITTGTFLPFIYQKF